jgi:signal peptidase II
VKARIAIKLLIIGIAIVVADTAIKAFVDATIPMISLATTRAFPYGGIAVFENFYGISFAINHSTNTGAAWGMFGSYQLPLIIIRITAIVMMTWYVFLYRKESSWFVPFTIIIAGAIGNVVDFFVYGHVVDMFHFILWGYSYPVFNVADMAICLGALSLVIVIWWQKHFCKTTEK